MSPAKRNTLSKPMTATNKLVHSYAMNSRTHRQNQSDFDEDLFHKPPVCTIRLIANASLSCGHSCSYFLSGRKSIHRPSRSLHPSYILNLDDAPVNLTRKLRRLSDDGYDVFHEPRVKHVESDTLQVTQDRLTRRKPG